MRSVGQRFFGSPVRIIFSICGALLVAVAVLAFMVLHANSPIPPTISSQVTFPLYYPKGSAASSFVIHKQDIRYDVPSAILQIPAASTISDHAITITEQAMPAKLTFDTLKGQGSVIDGAAGQAAVSNVEGRMVASMISSDRKTLILLNSTNATKEELTDLVKSLKPLY